MGARRAQKWGRAASRGSGGQEWGSRLREAAVRMRGRRLCFLCRLCPPRPQATLPCSCGLQSPGGWGREQMRKGLREDGE